MSAKAWMKRSGLRIGLAMTGMLVGVGVCVAAPITYNVNEPIGAGSVVGTVTTDGALGTLGTADVVAWSLQLNGLGGATYDISNLDSTVLVVGSDFSATPTDLLFNYSGPSGYLLFQQGLFSGLHYWCASAGPTACFSGETVTPGFIFDGTAVNVQLSGTQSILESRGSAPVPEPMSLTLLGLGLGGLGLTKRRRASR